MTDNHGTAAKVIQDRVKRSLRYLRFRLGRSPTHEVLRELARRGIDVSGLHALEMFGGDGTRHTRDFPDRVASREVWEFDPALEPVLTRNLPKARVRVVDSIQEVRVTDQRFGLISVDNPMSFYGDGYCEHFDLFPDAYRIARDETVFMLTVIPEASPAARRRFPHMFTPAHLARRTAFYHTDNPEHVEPDDMAAALAALAQQSGFQMDWHFARRRSFVVHELVFKVRRIGTRAGQAPASAP